MAGEGSTTAPPVRLGEPTPPPTGEGWMNLLDQDHVSGWKPNVHGATGFDLVDGSLHISGTQPGTYFGWMSERLRDFALHIEFQVESMVNSGVILRGEPEGPALSGVEVQILDDFGRAQTATTCGALYGVAVPMFNMSRPAGEWNSFDITFQGRVLTVFMNGWKILDVDLSKMTMPIGDSGAPLAGRALDGFLFVEDRGGKVVFRSIYLKKL